MSQRWIPKLLLVLACGLAASAAAASGLRARRMILYGASPFFFAPAGRNGLAAIQARLPEIAALGATAILLSPRTAPSSSSPG
jgi:hypothetical protein